MRGSTRQGLLAGVSTLLAVVVGVLINMVTGGWTWPLGAGLAALVAGWAGFEVWRFNRAEPGGDEQPREPAVAPRIAQLPHDTAAFTGRAAELGRLLALVGDPVGGTICAIDGMAGIGKTALAVHAAHLLSDRYPDGCLFLDLHGYTENVPPVEPHRALHRLLRAVGVPAEQIPPDPDDLAALWRSRTAGRRLLLVLDNARTAEQVRPLLPGGPGCLVLVTSRRRLLALDDARSLSLDVLPPADAAALFRRVAGEERVGGEAEAVERVVDRCGRLPLATRIAAARLRARPSWAVHDLAERMPDQADLADGERSVPAALALSYDDLDPEHRRMFRRLGLHPGTDFEAGAAAALDGAGRERAGRLLEDLLDAHLLLQAVPGRYRFHDLVRSFAARVVRDDEPAAERHACADRLIDHYTGTTADAVRLLHPAEAARRLAGSEATAVPAPEAPAPGFTSSGEALAWLDAERSNLVSASAFAAAHGRTDATTRLSNLLLRYFQHNGHHGDGLTVHTLARDAAGADRRARAEALNNLAVTLDAQGRFAEAAEHLREAADLYVEVDDPVGWARALVNLGFIHWRRGPYEVGVGHLTQALALARQAGDPVSEARALDVLALIRERQGLDDEAAALFHDAIKVFRRLGDRLGEADVQDSLGCIASRQGRHEEAVERQGRALATYRELGSRLGEANAINDLGLSARRRGDLGEAVRRHREALAIFVAIGSPGGESEARNGLGEAFRALGDEKGAERAHTAALALATESGDIFEIERARAGLTGRPVPDSGRA